MKPQYSIQKTNKTINIDDIINSSTKLARMLQEENKILVQMKIKELDALCTEKNILIDFLEHCKKVLANQNDFLAGVSQEKITALKDAQLALQVASEENMKRVTRARAVNQQVIELVRSALIKEVNKQSGYNESGSYGGKSKSEYQLPPFTLTDTI